jgi:hypothetical protein
MAKLADAPDLGSGSERSEGSSPFIRIADFIPKRKTPPGRTVTNYLSLYRKIAKIEG